jgi:hypothetical protein
MPKYLKARWLLEQMIMCLIDEHAVEIVLMFGNGSGMASYFTNNETLNLQI